MTEFRQTGAISFIFFRRSFEVVLNQVLFYLRGLKVEFEADLYSPSENQTSEEVLTSLFDGDREISVKEEQSKVYPGFKLLQTKIHILLCCLVKLFEYSAYWRRAEPDIKSDSDFWEFILHRVDRNNQTQIQNLGVRQKELENELRQVKAMQQVANTESSQLHSLINLFQKSDGGGSSENLHPEKFLSLFIQSEIPSLYRLLKTKGKLVDFSG